MFSSISLTAAVVGVLLAPSYAHMVMKSPIPYGADSLTNGPLAADGSDFPCKQRSGVYDISKVNSMAVGAPQSLSFKGSAVHGGGSCQLSVTFDKQPNKSSQWKVIHSIIGGCPSNVTGNLPENANGNSAATFQFKVPDGFPNGQATLAWTWFNKVGNREMYMNCAPIEVTGGSDNHDTYDALPDMFVANIPSSTCGTTENEDFVFPDPGKAAETPFSTALGSKTIGACKAAAATGYAAPTPAPAKPNAPSPNAKPDPQTEAAAPASASAPVITSAASAASAAPNPTSTQAPAYSTATTLVTVTGSTSAGYSAPAQTPSGEAPPSSNDGNQSIASGSCATGSVSCTSPGSVVCIGSSSFGLCDINNCAVTQSLSSGTSCKGGVISKRWDRHLARHLYHAHKVF